MNICQRYGVSRQTFYTSRIVSSGKAPPDYFGESRAPRPFEDHGRSGELRLTTIQRGDELTQERIGSALKKQFGVVLHTRTIEKLVKKRSAQKKLLKSAS